MDDYGQGFCRRGGVVRMRCGAGLKYDALMKTYVGTDPDPDIVPTPGQPYPKKDALRVMVESFAELMTQA